ncbi:MAG: caspase family protein [Planctomycetaceae bacterium]|nr:caspase family protein [Planctomycetaceae bacterium]
MGNTVDQLERPSDPRGRDLRSSGHPTNRNMCWRGIRWMVMLAALGCLNQVALVQASEQYAILVGVQKYTSTSGLRNLSYPERDVDRLAEVLTSCGWKAENITLLTQQHALRESDLRYYPSRENVQQELAGRLKLLDADDSLIIAFAGHGVQYRDDESFFCPADSNVNDRETLISLKSVYDLLEACPARFKLLLCDACRAKPTTSFTRSGGAELNSVYRLQDVQPPGGVAALFSCSPGEFAFEDQALKHGVFFHYVIEGLQGAADLDNDRSVDLMEITQYTQKQVKHFVFTKYDRAGQIPHFVGSTRGTLPIVSLPVLPTPPQLPDLAVGDIVVVTAAEASIQKDTEVVARSRRGDRFLVLGQEREWLSVRLPSNAEPLGWVRQHDVRKETSPPVHEDLFVKWEEQWWPARLLHMDGDLYRIHYYGHDDSWDESVSADRITRIDRGFEPYDVLVKWHDGYWPAKVLQRENDQYFVHYSGYNHTWNEWVSASELKSLATNQAYHDRINAELGQP